MEYGRQIYNKLHANLIKKAEEDDAEIQNTIREERRLYRVIRKWIILKTKSSTSTLELSKITGMHEFVVKQSLTKLKNVLFIIQT